MKKMIAFIMAAAMLFVCTGLTAFAEEGPNVLTDNNSTFEKSTSLDDSDWFAFSGGTLALGTNGGHTGDNYLIFNAPSNAWSSPSIDLYPILKNYKPDEDVEYTITCYFQIITSDTANVGYATAEVADGEDYSLGTLVRGSGEYDDNSFIQDSGYGGNHMATLSGAAFTYKTGEWIEYTDYLVVEAGDFEEETKAHTWNFCFDALPLNCAAIYIDDFTITEAIPDPTPSPSPSPEPTPIPTATLVPTAAVTETPTQAPAGTTENSNLLIIISIAVGVIVVGAGAFILIKNLKKTKNK